MTASQRRDFGSKGGFWVTSQFRNRYWVTKYTAVRFDDKGFALQRYCIHAVDPIPTEDNALMRKLLLECDEERFLRTANPGVPSKWDVERHETRTRQNPSMIQVDPVLPGTAPAMIYVNGIVRPLSG